MVKSYRLDAMRLWFGQVDTTSVGDLGLVASPSMTASH